LLEHLEAIIRNEIKELKEQAWDLNQILISPLTVLTGFVLTFIFADFTKV